MERNGGNGGNGVLDLSWFARENDDFLDDAVDSHSDAVRLIVPKEDGICSILYLLDELKFLSEVDFGNCKNVKMESLLKLSNQIQKLDLSGCFYCKDGCFEPLDDWFVKSLWTHYKEYDFWVSLSDFQPKSGLLDLRLRGLNVTDKLIPCLPASLEVLDVGGTRVKDGIKSFLARAKFLKYFFLDCECQT